MTPAGAATQAVAPQQALANLDLGSSYFPSLSNGRAPSNTSTTAGGLRPFDSAAPRVVLDLSSVAKQRSKSAVPTMGSSGLPWEKKKLEKMRKEAKKG